MVEQEHERETQGHIVVHHVIGGHGYVHLRINYHGQYAFGVTRALQDGVSRD